MDLVSWMLHQRKKRPAAPIETFARFQLPVIFESLMLAAGWLAGWLASWLTGWLAGWLAMIGCYLLE